MSYFGDTFITPKNLHSSTYFENFGIDGSLMSVVCILNTSGDKSLEI